MQGQTDFDLDRAIADWRLRLSQSPSYRAEDLEELESHLRDSVATLAGKGLSEEEAFLIATRRVGPSRPLALEFAKVNAEEVWLSRLWWLLPGGKRRMRKIVGILSALVTVLVTMLLFAYLPTVSHVGDLGESGAGLELGEWQVSVGILLTAVVLFAILAVSSFGIRFASSLAIMSSLALCCVAGAVWVLYSLRSKTGILNEYGHGLSYDEWWASVIPWTVALVLMGLCTGSSLIYWAVARIQQREVEARSG